MSHQEYTRASRTDLVDALQTGIVFERLEGGAVALPQELQPRCDQCPVRPVLRLIPTDRAQQDTLRCLARLQIVHIHRYRLVRLLLRLLHLRVRKLDEAADDDLDRRHVRILRDILILHESLLRGAALAHIDTELDKPQHDRLERRQRCRAEPLRREHFGEGLQCGMCLAYGDESLGLLQDCLWL